MQISENEKPGVSFLARSSSDLAAGVPIKKRPFFLAQSQLPPPLPPTSPTGGHDLAEKKPVVSEQDSSPTDACVQTASETALAFGGYSGESKEELMVKGSLDITTKGKDLPMLNSHVGSEIDTSAGAGTSHVKELNLDDNCTRHAVLGSSQLMSGPGKQTFVTPGDDSKLVPSDTSAFRRISSMEFQSVMKGPFEASVDGQNIQGSSLRQEKVDSFSSSFSSAPGQYNQENMDRDAELKVDSTHLSVDRSNWDLNTMMDMWEISGSDSAMNLRTVEQMGSGHDGINKENLNLDPVQMHLREPNIANWNDGRCVPSKSENLARFNLYATVDEQYNSDALLELQLKPSSIPEQSLNFGASYGEVNSVREMPPVGWLEKPISSIENSRLTTCKVVKPEPHDNRSEDDRRKVQMRSLNSVGFKHIKPEPIERSVHEGPNPTFSGDLRSAGSKTVKSEPVENLSQSNPNSVEGKSSGMGQHSRTLTACDSGVPQDVSASVSKALNLISESMRANIQHDASEVVGEALNLVPKACSLEGNKSYDGEAMPARCGIPHDKTGTDSEPSDVALKSLIFEGKFLNSVKGTREVAGLSADSLEPQGSDGNKYLDADSTVEAVAQIGCLDGENRNLSIVQPAEKINVGSCGNGDVAESSDMEISEDDKPGSSRGLLDAKTQFCSNDRSEDGGVRNLAFHAAFGGSCEERHATKAADSILPVDMPISHLDVKGSKVENIDKLDKGNVTSACDSDLSNNKIISTEANPHGSSDAGGLTSTSGKRRLLNTTHKLPQDHLKKDKGMEAESKSDSSPGAKATVESRVGEMGVQQEDSKSDRSRGKHSVLSKSGSLRNGDAIEHANDRGRCSHSLTGDTNSAPGKPKPISSRLIVSRSVRDRDKSPRRDRLHSRGSRDDDSSDRSRRFESDRYQHRAGGKSDPDQVHMRRRGDNQLDALRDDRIPDLEHGPGQANNAAGFRFPRPREAQDVGTAIASDGFVGHAGRLARKPTSDELQYFPRMPLRRQSPGGRRQVPVDLPMVPHPMRDINPARCIGRSFADVVALDHEEKLMRTLPDEIMDPRMLSRPLSPYERADDSFIHRGRRSLSPVQRRGPPLRIPRVCLQSSPRSQTHLLPQWTSPPRSPDGFDVHPEVIRCRSPPIIRPDRMRSPHHLACLPEDVLVRRHGSPPYIDRLPNIMDIGPPREHMMDIMPPREHEFPRPVRGAERGIQRFDLIDRREFAEEECFRPLLVGQVRDIAREECFDDRTFGGRQGLVRSIRQRLGPPGNNSENFHFRGEDGPPRSSRFCPEPVEEFPGRTTSRDLSGHIRNRLGNMTCRPRGVEEQEDNYMRHEQGWRNAASSDLRLKRRRF